MMLVMTTDVIVTVGKPATIILGRISCSIAVADERGEAGNADDAEDERDEQRSGQGGHVEWFHRCERPEGVLATMADLGAEGMTMLVVTHEMGFARAVAQQVLFMDHGRVVESGEPDQVFEAPGTPRLQRFLSQVL